MNKMFTINATDVRKDWSRTIDMAVREKPVFINRTRDDLILADTNTLVELLNVYSFTAQKYVEDDGSITLSLNEIDLIENAKNESDAKLLLAESIIEYAGEFYNNFALWSSAPNRKKHIPYILKALILEDVDRIGALILCQTGEN